MSEDQSRNDLEALVIRVLEQPAEAVIPEDFAASVRRSLPALPMHRRSARWGSLGFGKLTAIAMAALCLVVAFVLARRASLHFANVAFDVECLLMLQALAIAWWLAVRRNTRSF